MNTELTTGNYDKAYKYATGTDTILDNYHLIIDRLGATREEIGKNLHSDEPVDVDTITHVEPDLIFDYDVVPALDAAADTAVENGLNMAETIQQMINMAKGVASEYLNFTTAQEQLESGIKKIKRVQNYKEAFDKFAKDMSDFETNMSMDLATNMKEIGDTYAANKLFKNIEVSKNNREIKKLDKLDRESFGSIELFQEMYGLTIDQAIILNKAINRLGESCIYKENSSDYIVYVYGTLSTLCISYDAIRWRITTGQPELEQAINRLRFAGLSEQEILDLRVIINLQHGDYSDNKLIENGVNIKKSKYADETFMKINRRSKDPNNDFAHQIVQITAFANAEKAYNVLSFSLTRYLVDLFNSKDFQHSYTKYEISFKGDIDSGRYDEADYQSDVDAINIYERIKTNENKTVSEIWNEYYYEIKNGDTNRAKELFENLGDGDAGAGILVLQDILNEETIGSQFIIGENEESYKEARKVFMEWLLSVYYDKEYVFPEYREEG